MIKIIGLAVGLSIVFLIYIYTSFEKSYDSYHENGDRIYRVGYHLNSPRYGKSDVARTGHNLTSMLQNSFPEIDMASRIAWMGDVTIQHHNQKFKESKFLFADPSALKMFSFPMKLGNYETALNNRKSIIISSEVAHKYFGEENPLGKFLDDNRKLEVTGVIDIPDNSHFRFDILASYATIYDLIPNYKNTEHNLFDENVYSYIMLHKDANSPNIENKLKQFSQEHIPAGNYLSAELFLEPLKTIHFNSTSLATLGEFSFSKFTKPIVILLSTLGILIILIACFNFINIAVAQISERTKEVGIRKVFGANKTQLFFQFVCEYWLYSLIAILISILIAQAFLPFIRIIIGRQIEIDFFKYIFLASSLLLLITILAGAYPSFIIAKVNPIKALHSKIKGSKRNVLRTFLIISQFTVSIILILITINISKQINHFTNMDMGMNTNDLLVVKMEHPKVIENYQTLKAEFQKNSNVFSVTASSNIPAVTGARNISVSFGEGEKRQYSYISMDNGFAETLGIEIVEGKSLIQNNKSDVQSEFLLNKSAVKELGLENPIGESVVLYSGGNGNSTPISTGFVVGILEDYSYRPTYDPSKGVIINCDPRKFNAMFIRINPHNKLKTLTELENTWNKVFYDIPINMSYLDDEIKNDFFIQKLLKMQRFIIVATIFSFLLALSGLLGLSILSARQRVKEIGIRRVNGATLKNLLILMNKRLLSTVFISILISFPVVVFISQGIKSNQTNGIALSFLNYGIVFIVIALLTMLTVSWQSWRAATRNPVEALRYE